MYLDLSSISITYTRQNVSYMKNLREQIKCTEHLALAFILNLVYDITVYSWLTQYGNNLDRFHYSHTYNSQHVLLIKLNRCAIIPSPIAAMCFFTEFFCLQTL